MQKKFKKKDKPRYKTIKLDAETHRLLRVFAAEKGLHLGEAVGDLLDKAEKRRK